jgi:hemerythrin-like domain-containing protein
MQRSPQLVPLSHDHHVALEVALLLTRATEAGRTSAAARFVAHWQDRGRRHFAAEEQAFTAGLLPADPTWAGHLQRMRDEHERVRGFVADLQDADVPLATVHAAGELLRDHVRFEERVLFPYAEERLPPEALDAIGRALGAAG